MTNDIFANLDALPEANVLTIADRLEMRAGIESFAAMRDQYFDAMKLGPDARVLELGGGTGIVGRAYARRPGFNGRYVVSDLSASLIEYAKDKAAEDGLSDCMDFRVVDAMSGEGLNGETFDAVILHTLISHVPDAEAVLRTAVAATKPGGIVAVFDADYGSLNIISGNDELDTKVSAIVLEMAVAQPDIMRRVPRLAIDQGLKREVVQPHFLCEVGESSFFIGLAEALGGVLMAQGNLEKDIGDTWIAALHQAIENDSFFGMCPYFAYLYRKP